MQKEPQSGIEVLVLFNQFIPMAQELFDDGDAPHATIESAWLVALQPDGCIVVIDLIHQSTASIEMIYMMIDHLVEQHTEFNQPHALTDLAIHKRGTTAHFMSNLLERFENRSG